MKKNIYLQLSAALLFLIPATLFGQAPNLGTSADFVLLTTDGSITNTGISQLTGKVGTNNGSSTGFGNVNGGMHDGDAVSAQAAADLLIAYNDLNATTPTNFPAPALGNGQTLVAGVHETAGASTIDLNLNLDAQNDPNAVFIFKIEGPLSTSANANVNLINGAQACNVFWKVEGLVDMAAGTTMRGTVVANNAGINMNTGDTLEGRALSTNGAITIDGTMGYTPVGCGSPVLTGPDTPTFGEVGCYGVFSSDGSVENNGITTVIGDVGSDVGLTTGFDALLVTGNIHPIADSSTSAAAVDLVVVYNYLNGLQYDINLLYPAQFGRNLVLTPHTYLLDAATTFTDTVFLNARGVADAVFVIKINGALESTSYSKVSLINGTQAKNVYWLVNGAVDIADYSEFNGTIVSQGAVNLYTGTTINGRVLTGVGSLSTNAIESAADIDVAECDTEVGGDSWAAVPTNDMNNSVRVFPNPFTNIMNVDLENTQNETYNLTVYNTLGIVLINSSLSKGVNKVDMSGLSAGVYYYNVSGDNNIIKSGKLVSHK
ncbi:MAG: ice-binding family protein [Bacteroidota bacterium]